MKWGISHIDFEASSNSKMNVLKKQFSIVNQQINNEDFIVNFVITQLTNEIQFSLSINSSQQNLSQLNTIKSWAKSQNLAYNETHNFLTIRVVDSAEIRQKIYFLYFEIKKYQELPEGIFIEIEKMLGKIIWTSAEMKQKMLNMSMDIARICSSKYTHAQKLSLISKRNLAVYELLHLGELNNLKEIRSYFATQLTQNVNDCCLILHVLETTKETSLREFYDAKLLLVEILMTGLKIPAEFATHPQKRKIFVRNCETVFNYLNKIKNAPTNDPRIQTLISQAACLKEKVLSLSHGQEIGLSLLDKIDELIELGKRRYEAKHPKLNDTNPTELTFKFARKGLKLLYNLEADANNENATVSYLSKLNL